MDTERSVSCARPARQGSSSGPASLALRRCSWVRASAGGLPLLAAGAPQSPTVALEVTVL
jgi:hypothetical protein